MKKLLLSLIVVITWQCAIAQDSSNYMPMLEEGKVWIIDQIEYDVFDPCVPEVDRYHYVEVSVRRDTVVNGVKAKVLRYEPLVPSDEAGRDIVLYEENRRLYLLENFYLNDWSPLLDFNYKDGERTINSIWDGEWDEGFMFESEGNLFSQGKLYHYVQVNRNIMHTYWIEGVGSPALKYLTVFASTPDLTKSNVLGQVYLNGECIFDIQEFEKFSEVKSLSKSEEMIQIYDLYGREVLNPQPGSIYIRDGKKFVAR